MKRLVVLFSAAIASAAAAQAQTSVFDGHWRIVAAEPAAWTSGRATPAPLLRAGLIFRDGTAVMPRPGFCEKPQRDESWIPSRWLLGGEMSGKTIRAFYGRHGITEDANLNGMTLTCGDRETKLVLAEEGRALLPTRAGSTRCAAVMASWRPRRKSLPATLPSSSAPMPASIATALLPGRAPDLQPSRCAGGG